MSGLIVIPIVFFVLSIMSFNKMVNYKPKEKDEEDEWTKM
jgi:hypothetical protein